MRSRLLCSQNTSNPSHLDLWMTIKTVLATGLRTRDRSLKRNYKLKVKERIIYLRYLILDILVSSKRIVTQLE